MHRPISALCHVKCSFVLKTSPRRLSLAVFHVASSHFTFVILNSPRPLSWIMDYVSLRVKTAISRLLLDWHVLCFFLSQAGLSWRLGAPISVALLYILTHASGCGK